DAYDGTVTLYAWDADDPVLQTWMKIFPATVEPRSEMSETLLEHVRYPVDLFKVQRAILETYHVTDPGEFFSGNEAWDTPLDPAPPPGGVSNSRQPPYYLTMQVPGTDAPAFTLYSTYIPRTGASDAQNI